MTALIVIEAVVIVLLVVLMAGLLKSHAEILRTLNRLEGVAAAEGGRLTTGHLSGLDRLPSSHVTGVTPDGISVSIALEGGAPLTLLAFLSSGCASCRTFWRELDESVDLGPAEARVIILTKGPQSESPGKVRELGATNAPVIMADDAWESHHVPVTPYFLLIDDQRAVLGEGSAQSLEHLAGLFRQSVADGSPTRMDTREREMFTDSKLKSGGIQPGDESLYRKPFDS